MARLKSPVTFYFRTLFPSQTYEWITERIVLDFSVRTDC